MGNTFVTIPITTLCNLDTISADVGLYLGLACQQSYKCVENANNNRIDYKWLGETSLITCSAGTTDVILFTFLKRNIFSKPPFK